MRYFLLSLIFISSLIFGDEIYYDDGSQGGFVYNNNIPRFAVRFTPTGNCKVDSARLLMRTYYPASFCSLFVWDDASGLPGTLKTSKAFTIQAAPAPTWFRVGLPISLNYNTDFWIGVWMPPDSGGTRLYTDSNGLTHPTRDAWYTVNGWSLFSPTGDLMIRAIVKYVGIEEETSVSERVILTQNSPNPTTGNPAISYTLPERSEVKLEIYDITGSLIKTIVDELKPKGVNEVVWDRKDITGKRVNTGVYFYKIKVGNFTTTKKLTLL